MVDNDLDPELADSLLAMQEIVMHRNGKNVCKRRIANVYVWNTCVRWKLKTAFAKRLHLQQFGFTNVSQTLAPHFFIFSEVNFR